MEQDNIRDNIKEKAVIVGIQLDSMNENDYRLSIEELENLCDACNMVVVAKVEQRCCVEVRFHTQK